MKWTVIDTIACPNTGIVFSSVVSLKMLKLVIWYEGEVIIPPGSTIEPFSKGIKIDGEYTPLNVYNITPLKLPIWQEMKDKITCPDSQADEHDICHAPFKCALKVCPYGKRYRE
ncbi:anti-adapter protein IraM [Enterobacter cancerogenus]